MPSSFAAEFNANARPMLWDAHAEELDVKLDGATPGKLTGPWKRVAAEDAQPSPDGAGLTTYTGLALFVVQKSALPDISNLSKAEIYRGGETWHIRHAEDQDAWTWILHLGRRKASLISPRR